MGCSSITSTSHLLHRKLGHPNSVILKHLVKSGNLNNIYEFSSHLAFDCTSCKLGKNKSLSFSMQGSRAYACFEIIHTNVWGVSHVLSYT